MENSLLTNETSTIAKEFDKSIKKIMAIKYHYDLNQFFSNALILSEKKQNNVFEILINHYLNKIKSLDRKLVLEVLTNPKRDFSTFNEKYDIEPIINFFYYKNLEKEKFNDTLEEAYAIAFDLVAKVMKKKDRTIKLPIAIHNIKEYSINYNISKKDINELFIWLVLYLAVIYNYVENMSNV